MEEDGCRLLAASLHIAHSASHLILTRLLSGESLPDYSTLGSWLFPYSDRRSILPLLGRIEETMFLGESSAYYCWLVYKPDLAFLKSSEAALTLSLAERIALVEAQRQETPRLCAGEVCAEQ